MVPQAQFDRVQVDCQSWASYMAGLEHRRRHPCGRRNQVAMRSASLMFPSPQLDLWPSAVSRGKLVSEIHSAWSSAIQSRGCLSVWVSDMMSEASLYLVCILFGMTSMHIYKYFGCSYYWTCKRKTPAWNFSARCGAQIRCDPSGSCLLRL